MKSNMYVANTISSYRRLIDEKINQDRAISALNDVSNRGFCTVLN